MIVSPRHPFGLLLAIASMLVFAYLLLPLVVIVASAFGDTGYLAFPPQGFTLKWYQAALANPRFINGFLVSARVGAIVAAIAVVVGVAAAYAIVRRPFRGATVLEALFLSPLLLPTLVLAVALSIFFSRNNFVSGTDRLILAHVAICIPYVLRVTIPVLRRFDATLEEAAMNLGASPRAAFFLVTLPVIQPGVIAGATLAFIMSFDEIDLAIFLASPREPTLPVTIYSAVQLGFEPSLAAVSAWLILFTVCAMALFQFVIGRRSAA
jgi:putative spermidine/putrescine transport system permease protein